MPYRIDTEPTRCAWCGHGTRCTWDCACGMYMHSRHDPVVALTGWGVIAMGIFTSLYALGYGAGWTFPVGLGMVGVGELVRRSA